MQAKELMNILDSIAPLSLAEEYDNPGLIVGRKDKEIRSILLGLDLTSDLLKEAGDIKADAIITHHPFIFHSIKKIDTGSYEGRILSGLIKNDMAYIGMHTNVDKCKDGLNDYLAELVGIRNVKLLEDETECYQISVYVPKEDADAVKNAMFSAGAGSLGNYRNCSFESDGLGQFKPVDGARPYIGKEGKTERVDETKVEVYCDPSRLGRVIYAMVEAHPYEQPVYYALKSKGCGEYGFGRYGELEKEMTLEDYCRFVKKALDLSVLEYTGDKNKKVRTAGVCSGAGGDMYNIAVKLGLDAFITGDIKHNIGVLASQCGTALINGGHYGTEAIFKKLMLRHLQNRFDELKYNVNIIYSKVEKSPWSYV